MAVKRTVIAVMLFTAVLIACAAGGKAEAAGNTEAASEAGTRAGAAAPGAADTPGADGNTSYAFGLFMGMNLKETGFLYNFNYAEIAQGFKDAFEGGDTRLSQEEAYMVVQIAFAEFQDKLAAENKVKETVFMTDNGKRNGVVTTASGLQYEVVTEGNGPKPAASSTVRVNYEGTLIDGTVFDSSYTRGEPAEFPLTGVIPGWTEGIQLMSVGSTYKLYIPSELAYGTASPGGAIGPNSVLIFKVELLAIIE
ncbi:MAG: FKBP-type peptidyl-prolyl cis-trans isomerase [Treponema sp.]|jgi:FKBP-type peptidyl-prolyl cis-trans isomerase FkpA|nr:FKBP-type peptidyl-prolyl cis-trans isomerase [Treponema sp.]